MYDIREVKVRDIMVCGNSPFRQLFYIHNIDIDSSKITSSGVSESHPYSVFAKACFWDFDRKATEEECRLFYELIESNGFKFNVNEGVTRC